MRPYLLFASLLSVLLFIKCKNERYKTIDVSSVSLPQVKIERLDRALFEIDSLTIDSKTNELVHEYGDFYNHFLSSFICPRGTYDSTYQHNLLSFLQDEGMLEGYRSCDSLYSDVEYYEQGLTKAFKRFLYFFPEKKVPRVVGMFSGFNYSTVFMDSILSLGLEMYLGKDNKFYDRFHPDVFPKYRRANMEPKNLLPEAIKVWLKKDFLAETLESGVNLLDLAIANGKVLYLAKTLLHSVEDSTIIGYTADQWLWCQRNEFNVWSYWVSEELLFTTDEAEIIKFTRDGPFTKNFNRESPARLAEWVGWQIVTRFMNTNSDISMQQMLTMPPQEILTKSNYKPS